jgi:hypothetical protein
LGSCHNDVMRTRGRALALISLALATAGAGCSADKPEPKKAPELRARAGESDANRGFLSLKEVEATPARSPGRSVLEFWFAVQNRDLLTAHNALTDDFRREYAGSLRRFTKFILADYPHWLFKPKTTFTRTEGGRATVGVSYHTQAGSIERTSFSMRRRGGRWLIAYEVYLATRLRGE